MLTPGSNYKSFGDSKFIPRIPVDQLAALAAVSPDADRLFHAVQHDLYQCADRAKLHLGFVDQGHVSTYYPDSPDITRGEIEAIAQYLKKHEPRFMPENTRLRKTAAGFELLVASATTAPATTDLNATKFTLDGDLAGHSLTVVYGDHQAEMRAIARHLASAQAHAANPAQTQMHADYVTAFADGSMQAHKNSQRAWITDTGPAVECNIGFIETYRDPSGERGEWEGFVAMVNRERTRAFAQLVRAAPQLIPHLPWPPAFEKDAFLPPDFTSLEVLTFAGSGIPAGINIPNYDDVRQTAGFKNVSLGNVLGAASPPGEPVPFIRAADQPLYAALKDRAFELQVGLHELLGHGCGKLLQESAPGVFNFDPAAPPVSPVDGAPVTTWYKPGETWGSVMGGMGPSYEECRAECVAMSLCPDYGILRIFGVGDGSEVRFPYSCSRPPFSGHLPPFFCLR